MAPTIPVFTLDLTDHTNNVVAHSPAAQQPGVARFRQKLAVARTGGLSATLVIIGDSRVRSSVGAGKYRLAWPSRLLRHLMGSTPGSPGFLPPSQNTLSGVTDGDWPGGDSPWTYAGSISPNGSYGVGLHAVNIPSGGGSATITYFGDRIFVYYVQNPTGPTAATVTIDGASVGPLDANDAALVAGKQVQYGTDGQYGFHTLVITPNNGTLVLEGVQWYDKDAPFFLTGAVHLVEGGHVGFNSGMWVSNPNWSAMFQGGDVFMGGGIIVFDTNDIEFAEFTASQFEDNIVNIIGNMDSRLGSSEMSWLICHLPLPPAQVATGLEYVEGSKRAAKRMGSERVAVVDLAGLRPGRTWGADLSSDTSHPNDAGHAWVAAMLASIIDPIPATAVPSTPASITIDSSTPPAFRSSWTEAWTALTGGIGGYDQSGGGTTVGERRHRVWLDAGTYRATYTGQEDTGLGNAEVYMGRWVSNTPTLSLMGGKTNVAGTPTLVTTRLANTLQNDVPGYVPIIIRKTSATGAIRFVKLVLDKMS